MKLHVKCYRCGTYSEGEPRMSFVQQSMGSEPPTEWVAPLNWGYYYPPDASPEALCAACDKDWKACLADARGAFMGRK